MISSAAGAVARWISPLSALAAVVGIGCAPGSVSSAAPLAHQSSETNPLADQSFYLDPRSAARIAADHASPPIPELSTIADTPQAYWLDQAFPTSTIAGTVTRITGEAQASDTMPVLALYAIPHRDCGSFAAGGFATAAGYREWIDGVSAGLASSPVTIVLEPDALAMADCLQPDDRQERFDLIRYAVEALNRDPNAAVYIDGGNSRWQHAEEIARRLNQVGVEHARGFSLNTANFYTTEEEIEFGEQVSDLTNGAHYVIDTSRNGVGPVPESKLSWCNPAGRALGTPPTTETDGEHADAYLWVKRPGESDGSCNSGEPAAGTFVNQYAIDLVRNSGQ